jgi:hypothetical protein
MARRVQHHFDHALHILIDVFQLADDHSQAPSDRGTDLLGIEVLSLNFELRRICMSSVRTRTSFDASCVMQRRT